MTRGYLVLRIAYTLLPVVFGADKFFHLLVDYNKYLAPIIRRSPPVAAIGVNTFMDAVGVVEVLIGLLVWFRPRYGGHVLAAWLLAIVINLLLIPGYFDVAFRDLILAIGALALARLSPPRRPYV